MQGVMLVRDEWPGMSVHLQVRRQYRHLLMVSILATGNFADIIDLGDGTVVKAFRRNSHTNRTDVSQDDQDALTRGFFLHEVLAYEALQSHSDLEIFAPRFEGRIDPTRLEVTGQSPASVYVSGCGLHLERIQGEAVKIANLPRDVQIRVEVVLEAMQERIGLRDPWDGSCFVPGSRAEFTVIDFATWNDWLEYYEMLEEHGELTESARRRLRA